MGDQNREDGSTRDSTRDEMMESTPVPVPGERLSTAQVQTEAGKPVRDEAADGNVRASDPGGVRPAGLTAEALRKDHSGATESGAENEEDHTRERAEAVRIEGLIGNPD